MDENQYWVACWKCVAAIAIAVTVSTAGCVANTHYQITQALLHGADPLSVGCAHGIQDEHAPECSVLASKR